MQKLRAKKINDFVSTLNEREQKYVLEKLKDIIEERENFKVNFTINGKKSYLY